MDSHQIFYLAAQAALASVLWWSSFCRLAHIDKETIREIRIAVWLQGASSTVPRAAPYLPLIERDFPWVPLTTPIEIWLCLLASMVFIQIATSRHWANGTPRSYIKPECRPMRREQDFKDTSPC